VSAFLSVCVSRDQGPGRLCDCVSAFIWLPCVSVYFPETICVRPCSTNPSDPSWCPVTLGIFM
jgi:hypothetical protein